MGWCGPGLSVLLCLPLENPTLTPALRPRVVPLLLGSGLDGGDLYFRSDLPKRAQLPKRAASHQEFSFRNCWDPAWHGGL